MNDNNVFLKKIAFDLILGIVAILIGFLIIAIPTFKNFHQEDLGIVLIISTIVYILFKNHFDYKTNYVNIKLNWRFSWILFLLLYSYSFFLLTSILYKRPPIYFVIIALLGSIIAIEIFHTNINKENILLKIILLSFSIRYGIFYEFSSIGSGDLYLHFSWVEGIMQKGHLIEEMGRYYDSPLFHLTIATSSILSSFDIKSSYFISIVVLFIVSSIFIYLIGCRLMNERLALFAMLIVNISDISISQSLVTVSPGTLVYSLFLIVFYFIIKISNKFAEKIIIFILIFFIILTHQLSTFVSFLIIFITFISSKFYNTKKGIISTVFVSLVYISMISQWMFAGSFSEPFFKFAMNPFRHIFRTEEIISETTNNAISLFTSQYSFTSNVLFHIGFLLIVFFGVIGILSYISSKNINMNRFIIASIILGVFGLIYSIPLTGIGNNAVTTRWLIFGYTFLAFPAALGIFLLTNLFKYKKSLLFLLTFWLIFFMITSPIINSDSPIYLKERWPRLFFKDSEIMAAEKLVDISTIPIKLDSSFSIFRKYLEIDKRKSNKMGEQLIVARKIDEPVGVQSLSGEIGLIKVLDESHFEKYYTNEYHHVFDDGAVKAYFYIH